MVEHSPGPWKFVNDDGDEVPLGWDSDGYYNNPKIVAADGTTVVGCGEYNVFIGYPAGRQEANVALILSAPTIAARLAEVLHELAQLQECPGCGLKYTGYHHEGRTTDSADVECDCGKPQGAHLAFCPAVTAAAHSADVAQGSEP